MRKYALNNSYFKNKSHDMPDSIIEITKSLHTSNLICFDEVINQAINNKSVNTYKINGYENI